MAFKLAFKMQVTLKFLVYLLLYTKTVRNCTFILHSHSPCIPRLLHLFPWARRPDEFWKYPWKMHPFISPWSYSWEHGWDVAMVITYEIIEFVLLSGPRREGLTWNSSYCLSLCPSYCSALKTQRKLNKKMPDTTSLKYTALEEFKSRAVPWSWEHH